MSTILITGANRGIGLELVKQYYKRGWRVLAACRKPSQALFLNELAKESSGKISVYPLDVSSLNDINTFGTKLSTETIDILINNAGAWEPGSGELGTLNGDKWQSVLTINTISPILIAQSLVEAIARSKHKTIVNMSSDMASISDNDDGGFYVYRSSKAALNAASKSLSLDLQDRKIKVLLLHPGWVKTDMGGPDAIVECEDSVQGIINVLNTTTIDDSGSLITYSGEKLSW